MSALLQIAKFRIVVALLLVLFATGAWLWTKKSSLSPETLRIGMPTNNLRMSWKTFAYNEQGHYGNKIQFESKRGDAYGGSYSVSCREGKVYAIEINYPAGLERGKVIDVIGRVLGTGAAHPEEHDDKELSMKNCDMRSEYFYFDAGKIGAQIDYKKGSSSLVSRIYCWLA